MKAFHFQQNKHGVHLQMDMGVIQDTPHFFLSSEVHYADFFEIIILSEGNGHLELDTRIIPLCRGTFLFLSPFQKRRWFVASKQIKGYFLIFEKDFLNDFFADHSFVYRLQYFFNQHTLPYFVTEVRLFSFEHDIFEEIKHEFQHFQKDSPHLLRAILYYILIKLNRIFCEHYGLKHDTHLNNLAYAFKEQLEKNIREKQRVEDYARKLNTSRVSLNTAVKRQFGQTVSAMIKERLILEIKMELRYTTKSIAEIAYGLNFSEPNNMIRLFKAHTGLSPGSYRTTPLS